ncbi:hypothetical protein B0A49_02662 [Cryomyces minteri]|uniref:Uncharacterized protein n=1 Tax=Cryomyces minteri TaxID=331657 RepID=A0A4V6WL97_9PEZI|nr:hypothetical protein B0A49_02662 [Cryomyces minteri]
MKWAYAIVLILLLITFAALLFCVAVVLLVTYDYLWEDVADSFESFWLLVFTVARFWHLLTQVASGALMGDVLEALEWDDAESDDGSDVASDDEFFDANASGQNAVNEPSPSSVNLPIYASTIQSNSPPNAPATPFETPSTNMAYVPPAPLLLYGATQTTTLTTTSTVRSHATLFLTYPSAACTPLTGSCIPATQYTTLPLPTGVDEKLWMAPLPVLVLTQMEVVVVNANGGLATATVIQPAPPPGVPDPGAKLRLIPPLTGWRSWGPSSRLGVVLCAALSVLLLLSTLFCSFYSRRRAKAVLREWEGGPTFDNEDENGAELRWERMKRLVERVQGRERELEAEQGVIIGLERIEVGAAGERVLGTLGGGRIVGESAAAARGATVRSGGDNEVR